MIGHDVQVVLLPPILGAHAVDLPQPLIDAPQDAEGGRVVRSQFVGHLVVAVVVGVDGWHAAIDVQHHAEGLHLGEERVADRVQQGG